MPVLFLQSTQKIVISVEENYITDFKIGKGKNSIDIFYKFPQKDGGGHTGFLAQTADIVEGDININKLESNKLLVELNSIFKIKVIDRVINCINEKQILVIEGVGITGDAMLFRAIQDKSISFKIHKVKKENYIIFEGMLGFKKTTLINY